MPFGIATTFADTKFEGELLMIELTSLISTIF